MELRVVVFSRSLSHVIYHRPKHIPQDILHNPQPILYLFVIVSDPYKTEYKIIA
jgi:hypothetical protein